MKLKDIIEFLDEKIPPSLALDHDEVGFKGNYDLNEKIDSVMIYMDILPEDDLNYKNTLIVTHHPPLFVPKTPTYTIHSNWDIIDGGANDALAKTLKLEVADYFDNETNIGRICKTNMKFIELKKQILDNFKNDKPLSNIGIVSGFGLKNPEYVLLAKNRNIDILISGDLTQETAILAMNLGITLIDLNHHESEIPGLYALGDVLRELKINIGIVDKKPIQMIK